MDRNALNGKDAETLFQPDVIACSFDMDEQMKIFGTNLGRQMKSRQISAKTLAEKAGVSEKTV